MENPVNVVKSNLTIPRILGWVVIGFVAFFILDVTGATDYLLYPYRSIKSKFGPKA